MKHFEDSEKDKKELTKIKVLSPQISEQHLFLQNQGTDDSVNPHKTIVDIRKEHGIFVTIKELARFVYATTDNKKRLIVSTHIIRKEKKEKKEKTEFSPWCPTAYKGIRHSIEQGKSQPILDALSEVTKTNPKTVRATSIKSASIQALNEYINTTIPLELKMTKLKRIVPSEIFFHYNGLQININSQQSIVFQGTIKGKEFIGGVIIHIGVSDFDHYHFRMVTHLFYKYLCNRYSGVDKNVLPEMCYGIDVLNKNIIKADNDTQARDLFKKISNGVSEYSNLWIEHIKTTKILRQS